MGSVRHLYVHLPFCAHRCGYCDFVTVVGRRGQHAAYVDALLAELALERHVLANRVETVFLGGGTPTFTRVEELARLLDALPEADEVTVEANPETVTRELAGVLRSCAVSRVSIGAQSFRPRLLATLERRGSPASVRAAVHALRDVGFDNISLDLLYGIPGQSPADLDADLADALALEPEHLSCYELEAKRGTRFAHAHGEELARQAERMEGYFERVVELLVAAGYRWYETSNFCLDPDHVDGRDLRARHNLAVWRGCDYLGIGIGAVSTIGGERRRNLPSLGRYLRALCTGSAPPREIESLDDDIRRRERLLLGLRLDEPVPLTEVGEALDRSALARMEALGLAERRMGERGEELRLTPRGRFLGGAVTAELLALPEVSSSRPEATAASSSRSVEATAA
ncbi:MAG: radical SAM family heme chaperone HemW [Thermoleophilia bacterium]|nr:radical SAM family heme chaperone HemW [Thermoleophilia bacterium]